MSYVDELEAKLKKNGVYCADQVDPNDIRRIVNMKEWEYYSLEVPEIEAYLLMLAQHIYFLQQEANLAEAKEIELGNDFKLEALPLVYGAKIRSVDERWLFAAGLTEELGGKYAKWQNALADYVALKDLAKPATEKLNVLKRLYDEKRLEGSNRSVHKFGEARG